MDSGDENDHRRKRSSSPRRSKEEIEKMFHSCYNALTEQAKRQREQINAISDRLRCIKADQEIIESRNTSIQSYLSHLIELNARATSQPTAVPVDCDRPKP